MDIETMRAARGSPRIAAAEAARRLSRGDGFQALNPWSARVRLGGRQLPSRQA